MNTKDEAIHKALKVLNCLNNDRVYETSWVKGAINACEEALEQPAQEPACIYDLEAISWALDKLAKFGVTQNSIENALMADRLQLMLYQAPDTHPAQEHLKFDIHKKADELLKEYKDMNKKYGNAPSWQGLSDDEIRALFDYIPDSRVEVDEFARAIEQALKEKNT